MKSKNVNASNSSAEFTATPLNKAQAAEGHDAEWMRLPAPGLRLWGLSRTTWIELMDSGKVKGVNLRKRYAKRGIRLIHRPSAQAYLESLMETAAGAAQMSACG